MDGRSPCLLPIIHGREGEVTLEGMTESQGHHQALPIIFHFSTVVTFVSWADPPPGSAPLAEVLLPCDAFSVGFGQAGQCNRKASGGFSGQL